MNSHELVVGFAEEPMHLKVEKGTFPLLNLLQMDLFCSIVKGTKWHIRLEKRFGQEFCGVGRLGPPIELVLYCIKPMSDVFFNLQYQFVHYWGQIEPFLCSSIRWRWTASCRTPRETLWDKMGPRSAQLLLLAISKLSHVSNTMLEDIKLILQ